MPDLGLLTRKVGPLPVIAWAGIGVGGYVLVRALTGGGDSAPIITDGFDPDAVTGGGGSIGGAPVASGDTIGDDPGGRLGGLLGPPTNLPPTIFPGGGPTWGGIDSGYVPWGSQLVGRGRVGGGSPVLVNVSQLPQVGTPRVQVAGRNLLSGDRRRVAASTISTPIRSLASRLR